MMRSILLAFIALTTDAFVVSPSRRGLEERSAATAISTVQLSAKKSSRKGASSRRQKGFGSAKEEEEETASDIKEGRIYSLPALYDLAFGYRNFADEVDFLLYAHLKYGGYPATRILELAAGPARHSIEALVAEEGVQSVTALDMSPEMVEYGKQVADNELGEDVATSFTYLQGDMRNYKFDSNSFDAAWILLGSLQHMTTNDDVLQCFQTIHNALQTDGTLILELPHPRETFSMVECTRNGWEVPLEDDTGKEYGELAIVWGDDNDAFDPITQVRQFSVSMELKSTEAQLIAEGLQSVRQVVPMRQFTAQEIAALAHCSGFEVCDMFGALDEETSINDNDEAFRLVCVLKKKNTEDDDDDEDSE